MRSEGHISNKISSNIKDSDFDISFFKEIFEESSIAKFIINEDKKLIVANKMANNYFFNNIVAGDILVTDYFHSNSKAIFNSILKDLLNKKFEILEREIDILNLNETAFRLQIKKLMNTLNNNQLFLCSVYTIKKEIDILKRMVSYMSDYKNNLAEKKVFQKEFYLSEFKYKALVENYPNSIMYLYNKDYVCIAAGGSIFSKMGIAPETFEGKLLYKIIPEEILEPISPSYREVFRGIEFTDEIKYLNDYYAIKCSPVYDNENKIIAGIISGQNITNIKGALFEIEESEEKYRRLIEALPDIIYRFSFEKGGLYYSKNVEKILGWPLKKFNKKPFLWYDSIHPQHKSIVDNAMKNFKQGHKFDIEYKVKTASGKYIWLRDRSVESLLSNEGIIVEGIATDITEAKKTEEKLIRHTKELKNSYHELEQFSYLISHDLQEPVRMVANFLGMIERNLKDSMPDKLKKYLYYSIDGSVRIQEMIQAILSFSRASINAMNFTAVNSDEIIKKVLNDMRFLIKESKAEVRVKKLPVIMADEMQISRVFINLISNSIKFMPTKTEKSNDLRNPAIEISAEPEDNFYKFAVKDNGIGFEQELEPKIYEIFRKTNTTTEYPGTGMGLTICKKIIERHNGKIWAISKPGKGTTFYFTLPVVP
ncbi:MAG: ATP-binding protein [Spirochaetia bacterium]|nr:ATP-binding protein [Spirochaetia bacterium]